MSPPEHVSTSTEEMVIEAQQAQKPPRGDKLSSVLHRL